MIFINDKLTINEDEVQFEMTRGGGPGGQKVNKTASRITLVWDLMESPSLTNHQRDRLLRKLGSRLSKEGVLRIDVQSERSQGANKREAVDRFSDLLRDALREQKPRKKTKPTTGSKKRRLADKKKRGDLKRDRGRRDWD